MHPKVIEEIFERLTVYSIIDYRQSGWLTKWNQLDVSTEVKNKGVRIRSSEIKKRICTDGINKMKINLFQDLKAHEEIKEWFKAVKKIID